MAIYENMELPIVNKMLCKLIVKILYFKFDFELNYKVFCIKFICNCRKILIYEFSRFKRNHLVKEQSTCNKLQFKNNGSLFPSSPEPEGHFFSKNSLFAYDQLSHEIIEKENFKRAIKKVVEDLKEILLAHNAKVIKETTSTGKFWLDNYEKFHYLNELANILYYINSSSSFIERFFSIYGFVQDRSKMNIRQIFMYQDVFCELTFIFRRY